jgi:GxxExxY protein
VQIIGAALEKKYQPDFVCYDQIVVEIKALSCLFGTEEAQLINYLKAAKLKVGLLLNFGTKSLEHKRFVYNLRNLRIHFCSRRFWVKILTHSTN